MPIISKEAAQRHLDMWMEAEAAVSTGQSYQIEQMMLTRASLKQIRESIIFWEKKVAEAEAEEKGRGRNRIYHFWIKPLRQSALKKGIAALWHAPHCPS